MRRVHYLGGRGMRQGDVQDGSDGEDAHGGFLQVRAPEIKHRMAAATRQHARDIQIGPPDRLRVRRRLLESPIHIERSQHRGEWRAGDRVNRRGGAELRERHTQELAGYGVTLRNRCLDRGRLAY